MRCDEPSEEQVQLGEAEVRMRQTRQNMIRRLLTFALLVITTTSCARAPAERGVVAPLLDVPPIGRSNGAKDSPTLHFNENSPAPSGCFAMSRRTGAVACIVGAYSLTAEKGDRKLTILSSSDDQVPDIEINVIAKDGGVRFDQESLALIEKTMREGDYMALSGAASSPMTMATGSNQVTCGMVIGLTSSESRSEDDQQHQGMPIPPPRARTSTHHRRETDLRLSVILDRAPGDDPEANADDVLLHNTITDISCVSASLNVRVLDTSIALIERECRQNDNDIVIGAWLCDSEKKRCD